MSQLHASSKEKSNNKHLYYLMPKTTYEKFKNKKWVERKYIFESWSTFISRAIKAWRDSSDSEKQKFLNSDLPLLTKSRIALFFKQKKTTNSAKSSLTTNTPSVTISREVVMESSEPTHNIASTITSVNACLAIENREKILSEREIQMLKNFFMEIKVSYEQSFTTDVKNDQKVMQLFTKFIYK